MGADADGVVLDGVFLAVAFEKFTGLVIVRGSDHLERSALLLEAIVTTPGDG